MAGRLAGGSSGLLFVAVTALSASVADAAPLVSVRPDGSGFMFQITPSADLLTDGSSVLRVALAADETIGRIREASVYSPLWQTGYSAYNPFVLQNTTALWNGQPDQAFASFESVTVSSAAPLDFLRLKFAPGPTGQLLQYSATIIQDGVTYSGIVGTTGVAIQLTADFNSDGAVNQSDLALLDTNYGRTGATKAQGDTNSDGVVNLLDLDQIGSEYFPGTAAVSIPEPASVGLLIALIGFARPGRASRNP
jgi:hypothetical protein